jgi:hypothetical protein
LKWFFLLRGRAQVLVVSQQGGGREQASGSPEGEQQTRLAKTASGGYSFALKHPFFGKLGLSRSKTRDESSTGAMFKPRFLNGCGACALVFVNVPLHTRFACPFSPSIVSACRPCPTHRPFSRAGEQCCFQAQLRQHRARPGGSLTSSESLRLLVADDFRQPSEPSG